MLQENNKGFSLIEIIVVLIVVGVLAAVALPNFSNHMQRSTAQEALNTLSLMRSAMESCGLKNNYLFTECSPGNPWTDKLDMEEPSSSNFTYTFTSEGQDFYTMKAEYKPDTTNYIQMDRTSSGITCNGYGAYSGICN